MASANSPPQGSQQPLMGQMPPGGQPRMAQFQPGQQPPPGAIPIPVQLPNGQQLTPEQMQQIQQQFLAEAARQGLTPQEFSNRLRAQAMAQHQARMQAGGGGGPGMPGQPGQMPPPGGQGGPQGQQGQQQGQQQTPAQGPPPGAQAMPGQQVPIQPGPPKPEAIELAKFLKSQNLKTRPCIFQEKRKELFKVKRAIRAIQSPAYEKARAKKGSLLPPVTDRASAENTFKLLPISMLALRVAKIDSNNIPHGQPGHVHGAGEGGGKKKGKKGQLWNVAIVPQQEANDDFHYIWFYEGSQWKQKAYAALALLAVFAVVMFPLWPYTLRRGVWYLSMGCLGLLGLFFALAIVRLIFFIITVTAGPKPGIWLFPNLFEDVGFFDSFKPTWAWRETKESLAAKKVAKKEKKALKAKRKGKEDAAASLEEATNGGEVPVGEAVSSPIKAEAIGAEDEGATGAEIGGDGSGMSRRTFEQSARIEEVGSDEE